MSQASLTRSFDPRSTKSTAAIGGTAQLAVYGALMRYDHSSGQYKPWVAQSLTPNDDFTAWTLKLPEDAEFTNGDPFTATAVKESIAGVSAPSFTGWIDKIESMEVVDPTTLEFHLTESAARFPWVLAEQPGMIVNTAAAEAKGKDFITKHGAGAGPYTVARFVPGEETVLKAKPDYWAGATCIDEIRVVPLPINRTRYSAFQNGEADISVFRNAEVVKEATEAYPEAQTGLTPISLGDVFIMNSGVGDNDPITADVRIRQALAYALDVEATEKRVYEQAASPSSTIVSVDSIYASDGLSGPTYDPARARKLVQEVKAETGWDGTISFICSEDRQDLALASAAYWENVGFNVDLKANFDLNELVQNVFSKQAFEVACWGLSNTEAEPGLNISSLKGAYGYSNADMTRLSEQLSATTDVEKMRDIIGQMQEVWNKTIPAIGLNLTYNGTFWKKPVHGVRLTVDGIADLSQASVSGG